MAGKITSEQLHVKCRFNIFNIRQCHIHAEYGRHTGVRVMGMVKSDEARKAFTDMSKEKLEISCRDASGTERMLFVGIITQIEFTEEGRHSTISIQAVSYSWKMDIKRKSRSFQCLSQTYRDVAETVLSGYGGSISFRVSDKKLEYPLIQYNETDFVFLKRILSYIGAGIAAGDTSGKIHLTAGIHTEGKKVDIDLSSHVYSQVPYQKKGKMTEYTGYEIWDVGDIRVGDAVTVQGKTFYVKEEELKFEGGILNGRLRIFPKACFQEDKMEAETLAGIVLTGTVLKTAQETVKLKLDIDKEQDEKDAYAYPWRPVTGNFLYCMPEAGTRVALYFGRAEESSGAVIYSIRENGEVLEEFEEYPYRNFTTVKNKRMNLDPSTMGLRSMTGKGGSVSLADGGRISVSTGCQMSILAEGPVTLRGKNIVLRAAKEATLVRKDMISPTVINLCNAFDAIGKVGGFASLPQEEKKEEDTHKIYYKEKSEYSLSGAVAAVLSNLPADSGGNTALDKIAAAMPWMGR